MTAPAAVYDNTTNDNRNTVATGPDGATGSQVWTQSLGAPIQTTSAGSLGMYSGLAAGDGMLVVPSGNNVTAYVLSTNP